MNTVIGIDVGGSTTKIVGFAPNGDLIQPMNVTAADPLTSLYGAFGKFTAANGLELGQIEKIMLTGVGSSYINQPIYGLPCSGVPEFSCIGLGGLFLSRLKKAIVVSMGTGTAIVYAEKGRDSVYLGGTGVGGGTVIGLARKMLGMDDINHIINLADGGNLDNVDLRIKDITRKDILPGMPGNMTAANFGNLSDMASPSDIALAILNMVFETAGVCAIFNARNYGISDIVLTGNLTTVPQAKTIFAALNDMFHVNFIIPELAQYGPVMGAALSVLPNLR